MVKCCPCYPSALSWRGWDGSSASTQPRTVLIQYIFLFEAQFGNEICSGVPYFLDPESLFSSLLGLVFKSWETFILNSHPWDFVMPLSLNHATPPLLTKSIFSDAKDHPSGRDSTPQREIWCYLCLKILWSFEGTWHGPWHSCKVG